MEIITKLEQATNEELLDGNYIKENILENLCELEVEQLCDGVDLLRKLSDLYEDKQGKTIDKAKIKIDSILFQISCTIEENQYFEEAKIPDCFENAYFWHYFFAMAFPLAVDDKESLCDLIQDQYPLQEEWLEKLFKDAPLQLELDEKVLAITFEMEEVKYVLDGEEIYALFNYDTLAGLTEDDEVLFMLLLPVVVNKANPKLAKSLTKIVEEFPIYSGLHKRVVDLLVKHITTEV